MIPPLKLPNLHVIKEEKSPPSLTSSLSPLQGSTNECANFSLGHTNHTTKNNNNNTNNNNSNNNNNNNNNNSNNNSNNKCNVINELGIWNNVESKAGQDKKPKERPFGIINGTMFSINHPNADSFVSFLVNGNFELENFCNGKSLSNHCNSNDNNKNSNDNENDKKDNNNDKAANESMETESNTNAKGVGAVKKKEDVQKGAKTRKPKKKWKSKRSSKSSHHSKKSEGVPKVYLISCCWSVKSQTLGKHDNSTSNAMKECLHYHYGSISDLSLDLDVDKDQPFNHLWWYCAAVENESNDDSDDNDNTTNVNKKDCRVPSPASSSLRPISQTLVRASKPPIMSDFHPANKEVPPFIPLGVCNFPLSIPSDLNFSLPSNVNITGKIHTGIFPNFL
ncbi:hypothetical protein RFI_19257 [Reticulomyxa filosa]|uniref:Uncharacterized protein n=1 Tax=Reticulomyxa filosa TaxID=46433 RepID=X6MVL7_RETFI|nr:hypothetical protein RFI_19257 [Reticulomyxa filosa]|eukprot:ETO18038.1 hypothetical protein RFI_19257 [Reticulomyxa filosa]